MCRCVFFFSGRKQHLEVASAARADQRCECIRLVKSHSYSVQPALTSVLCNGCGWQRCAPSLSVVRGIKTALHSSLYTGMRWKIMIPFQRSTLLTSMKTKGKASFCRTEPRLLAAENDEGKMLTSNYFYTEINIKTTTKKKIHLCNCTERFGGPGLSRIYSELLSWRMRSPS